MNTQQQVILDNYHNPQNFGKPDQFTHHMRLENFTCGDAVEIYLEVVEGKIQEAHFDGEGCSISIASASMLTDKLKGKTIAEVQQMNIDDMLELVGIPLTPSRRRCAYLSLEATQKALSGSVSGIDVLVRNIVSDSEAILEDYDIHRYHPKLDYVDIFPEAQAEFAELTLEISKLGTVVVESPTGNTYRLSNPINTKRGPIDLVRVRIFDETRKQFRGHPDYAVDDFESAKAALLKLPNVNLITRPEYEMIEIWNTNYSVLLYIPSIPLSEDLAKV